MPFGERLLAACEAKQSAVVVGLDPRLDELPDAFKAAAVRAHGPTDAAIGAALRGFHRALIPAVAPHAVAVKIQAAFYELYGAVGIGALEDALRCAREHGLLAIVDGKRNDIGSTAVAYADAYLGEVPRWGRSGPGPLRADALTVSPYPGEEGIRPFIERCQAHGTGLFVLLRTSNPGSSDIQEALVVRERGDPRPLYERVAHLIRRWGEGTAGAGGYASVGAVVGVTQPDVAVAMREALPGVWFLLPGYGAQGGGPAEAVGAFDPKGYGALVSASRHIARAYQMPPWADAARARGEGGFAWAAGEAAAEMRRAIAAVLAAKGKGRLA